MLLVLLHRIVMNGRIDDFSSVRCVGYPTHYQSMTPMAHIKSWFSALLLSVALVANSTAGVTDGKPPKDEKEALVERILKENDKGIVYGPADLKLGDVASMSIKRGQAFLPPQLAMQLFKALGEDGKRFEGMLGLILPGLPGDEAPTDDWGFVGIFYNAMGFVRDADAKSWETAKLLDNLRKNVETRNEELRKRGEPERELLGWVETPKYDESSHRLLWATSVQQKGKPDSAIATYNAVALGRYGLISFTFGTAADKLVERKSVAADLLNGIHFNKDKRYEDFAEGTDLVAEIGLAALVGGIAAKKLGLFAMLAILLAKWGKVAALAAGGGLVWSKFRKKKQPAQTPT